MCGIVGIFQFGDLRPLERDIIQRMCDTIVHRGPDGQGIYIDDDGRVGLGHRRLSIIDIVGGGQPMSNASSDLWVVFNGEIYNYVALRKELSGKGYTFRTHSDTEVILALYELYGRNGISRLTGIFAFALYDRQFRRLLLVRDHFGVKPLYYFLDRKKIVFGSEIKAILCDSEVNTEVDANALTEFLVLRYTPSPLTLFRGIRKLEPGSCLVVANDGSIEQFSYWDYSPRTRTSIREEEAIEEYQRLLTESVTRQMVADVPVGILLSGGIDSAAIGYLMRNVAEYRVKSFTIGFPGKGDHNELADAQATARYLHTEHHELSVSREDYLNAFVQSFSHTEEPIAEPTIPALFLVTHLAAQHVKVVLAGQGADEPLGGYRKYLGEALLMRLGRSANMLPFGLLPRLFARDEGLVRLARASKAASGFQRFLTFNTIFTPGQLANVLEPHSCPSSEAFPFDRLKFLFDQSLGLSDSLSRILFVDTRSYLSDDLLIFGDKTSMANSLEMRVPFLDPALVTFLESLPGSFKIRRTKRKYIHKKAVSAWLPQSIVNRKKRGFLTPMDHWLRTDLGTQCARLVSDKGSFSSIHLRTRPILQMIEDHRFGKADYHRHLFAILCLEIWYRRFFKNQLESEISALIDDRPSR